MYWQEWIDWIKKNYNIKPEHFKTHWRQWNSIRARMQAGLQKNKVEQTRIEIIPSISFSYQDVFPILFQTDKNYWLELGKYSEIDRYLYDCSLEVIDILLSYSFRTNFSAPDFAIIDKKYHWATYFTRDSTYNLTQIVICGAELESKALQLKQRLEQ